MRTWLYAQNPFLNATEQSYHSAREISIFHENALNAAKADPVILPLYTSYHPIHLDFMAKYDQWQTQCGLQEGDTHSLVVLLEKLSSEKIKDWDIKIQNVYLQGTPQYTRLLPDRRGPFQRGSQSDRISVVDSLSSAIGSDEALAAIKADVTSYFNKLDAARTTQKTSKSTTVNLSNALEDSRFAICTGQFVNLGSLIQKYPNSPVTIESFFDLATIRSSKQSEYTGTMAPEESKFIVKHTFDDGDEIMLSNTGDSKLRFYLAPRKDSDLGTVFIEMNKGEQTVLASALGDLNNAYLKVFNADALLSGSFTIKIL